LSGFSDLPLHDGVLQRIEYDWQKRSIRLDISAFIEPGEPAVPHNLTFMGVQSLVCPQKDPWGPSMYINKPRSAPGHFVLEMQSGDEIVVEAAGFEFTRAAS
jgi:hypothetical protein